jgi:hypothetical protein
MPFNTMNMRKHLGKITPLPHRGHEAEMMMMMMILTIK